MPVDVDVLAQSRALIEAGEMAVAEELLAAALGVVAPDPSRADEQTAEAAALRTGVLLALGEPYAARGWAAYGHAAHRHLHGESDRRTLHMLGLLAAVLSRVGSHQRAAQRYQQLIAALRAVDGPDGDRVLAARADLATVEHARGQCTNARLHMSIVLAEHQARHGAVHPLGIRMQARLGAMWRDCGDFDHAHLLFAEARGNAAGLGPGDPVHQLLGALARAAADPRHRCGFDALARVPDAPSGTTLLDEPARSFTQPEPVVADQPLPRRTPAPRERMALPLSSAVPAAPESDGRLASALDLWPTQPTPAQPRAREAVDAATPERSDQAAEPAAAPATARPRKLPRPRRASQNATAAPVRDVPVAPNVEPAPDGRPEPVRWSYDPPVEAARPQQAWEQPVVSADYHGLADQEPLHDPTSPWLHVPLWASMPYLPEHPDVSARQPAQIIEPTRQRPEHQPVNVVLVASIIGIVAITVLFMLVVSAARPG